MSKDLELKASDLIGLKFEDANKLLNYWYGLPRCSICLLPYYGRGHNAEPIKNGRCCDECNDLVIAQRIYGLPG